MKVPKGWAIKSVSELANVVTGNTPPTRDIANYGNDVPFITPGDLGNNKYITSSMRYLSFTGVKKARILPVGTTLFTCIGSTIGKIGLSKTELTTNQQINAAIPNKGLINGEYLYYSLAMISPKIKRIAGIQAVPIINKTEFENQILVFPFNLTEQKAIADTLATWDQMIEKTEKLIELKEKKLKTLIRKLLKKAHENHTTEYQTLGSILKYEQPTKYIVLCTDYDKNNGIPVLTANKGFILGYTNETSNVFEKNLPAIIFDDFTTDSKFVDFPFKVKSSAMKILYPVSQDYDSLYIFLAMTEIDVLLGGHKRYWLSEYQFYEIPVPNYETQKELSNIYKLQLEEIKALNKLLQNYKSQKQGLMQKLLTGKWKVQVKEEKKNDYD